MAPPIKAYASALIAFMSYRDKTEYAKTHQLTASDLSAITPEDIEEYFNFRAYGTPTPTAEMRPTQACCNTLMDIKKKISKFMPLRELTWHPVMGQGNPTKSTKVNNLIAEIHKAEVRHKGKPSQATRSFTLKEFISILDLVSKVKAEDAVA